MKAKKQHEEWSNNVYNVIKSNISKQVKSIDSNTLHEKKLESYSKYIDITNNKVAVFRDIIIESDCEFF